MSDSLISQMKGLCGMVNLERPSSAVDLSGLIPEPIDTPVIFVIGSPRSGTTALGNIVGANRRCVSADESLFLLSLWLDFDEIVLGNNKRGNKFLGSYTTPQKALRYTSEYVAHFYSDLLASKSSARYVVDHTPWHGYIYEFISLMFPDAYFLHIIRNPEDVVRSLAQVRKAGSAWGQDNDELRLELRNRIVAASSSIKEKSPDHYFEIHYEDFCKNPERSLHEFLDSIGCDWENSMSDAMKIRYASSD